MNTIELEIFPWNENFATGIEIIDDQHKRLVSLLNILVGHLAFNADAPTLNTIFDELKDYTVFHFSAEELIWHEYFKNDSWEAWHKDAHGDFIAQVLAIKHRESEESIDEVIAEIVRFLTHWLALHIIESDKRMAKVVQALPTGISLQRAKDQANEEMSGATRILIDTVMGMYDKLANRTILLTREISWRQKLEAELSAARDELVNTKNATVEANRSNSLLLANMRHQIGSSVNGQIEMTDALLKTALTEEQQQMVHTIRESARSLRGMFESIGVVSEIEGGMGNLAIEPATLADAVETRNPLPAGEGRVRAKTSNVSTTLPQVLSAPGPDACGNVLDTSSAFSLTPNGSAPLALLSPEGEKLNSTALSEPAQPSLSIMVLDDDTFMHDLMTCMLEGLGYSGVACHETGEAALAVLDGPGENPDVILLDINMPGMDGIEVVQQLAQRHYPGSLILISGEDELMLRTTAKLAQEKKLFLPGSVRKPPLPDRLAELLQQCGQHDAQTVAAKAKRPRKTYDAAALRKAIANGELVNYYQPKVAIPGGEWIGVETLVRWRHPEDGLVFPDQFIAVAEAEGLIGDLTHTVLQEAVRQAQRWRDQGLELGIAVNVSMEDLTDMAFADFAIEQLAIHDVPPQCIILEITEGRLMQDFATALHILSRLRLKRFRLSIDDFGTGNSSLAQLRDLPFDELKIDRSFTHNAGQDARLRALFEGSLEIARQLHMKVVAEGVEDEQDWDFLTSVNCNVAQGYLISRPIPAADIPAWHAQWQQRRGVS